MERRLSDPGRVLATAGMSFVAAWALLHTTLSPDLFVVVPAIIAATLAALCWFRGRRWRYLTGVVGVLMLLSVATSETEGLSRIDSVLDFSLLWAGITGAIFAIVAAVITALDGTLPAIPIAAAAGVALIVLTGVSAAITLSGRNTLSAAELDGAVLVRAVDSSFSDEEIVIPASGSLRLALVNDGRIFHTFTSDRLQVDEGLSPGRQKLIDVEIPAGIQSVSFYCKPHSIGSGDDRSGMVGVFTIE